MLEKLIEFFKSIFGNKLKEETKYNPVPQPTPIKPTPVVKEDDLPEIINAAQDGAEVKSALEITVIDENKNKIISGPIPSEYVEIGFDTESGEEEERIERADEKEGEPVLISHSDNHKPRYLWCLDNGHGKLTAGKRSPIYDTDKQFLEYEFNRDIVERIMKRLDEIGVRYFDIVPDYEKVGNIVETRVNRANWKRSSLPKIYLSVHSNAGPALSPQHWIHPRISGVETWHYHGSRRGTRLASIFQKHIVKATGWKNRHLKSRPENQFYILKKTRMAAILTENGFFNNRDQVDELTKSSVRQKIAEAHVQAILEVEWKGV